MRRTECVRRARSVLWGERIGNALSYPARRPTLPRATHIEEAETGSANARAELAAVERQQADLAQLARDLDLAAEQARRRNLYGHAQNSSAIPAIPGKSA